MIERENGWGESGGMWCRKVQDTGKKEGNKIRQAGIYRSIGSPGSVILKLL